MADETLTILDFTCVYLQGQVFVTITTLEENVLDLIYTSVKPRRHAVFQTEIRPRKVHHWEYTMSEVHRIEDFSPFPKKLHIYSFRFPELNDTLYFAASLSTIPFFTGPQSPIFAFRLPLTPTFIEYWPGQTFGPAWDPSPDNALRRPTVTPGRAALRATPVDRPSNEVDWLPGEDAPPSPQPAEGLFVLYDAIYHPINQDDRSVYSIDFIWRRPGPFLSRSVTIYGDINDDPCTIISSGFLGNFQPHVPHLFCLDLYYNPPTDLCGNTLPTGLPYQFTEMHMILVNQGDAPAPQDAVVVIRPFAAYSLTGDFQNISRHWPYLRPLLPQSSTPMFSQPPFTP